MTVPEPTSIQPTPPSYTVLPAAASRPAGPVTHGSNLSSHQQSANTSGTAVYVRYVVDITLLLSCTASDKPTYNQLVSFKKANGSTLRIIEWITASARWKCTARLCSHATEG